MCIELESIKSLFSDKTGFRVAGMMKHDMPLDTTLDMTHERVAHGAGIKGK
jgi:hypothetical protein